MLLKEKRDEISLMLRNIPNQLKGMEENENGRKGKVKQIIRNANTAWYLRSEWREQWKYGKI